MAAIRIKLLICTCFLLVSGCSFKDIDKRFFVVTIGVDRSSDDKKPYEVSLKLAVPNGTPKVADNTFIVVSEQATSISEAIRVIKSKVDKELDFGHAKVIILGEKIIHDNLRQTVDFFARRRDIQQIAWMAQGKPDAKTVLLIKPKSERLPSNSIFLSFGQAGTQTPFITSTYLFDFRRKLFDEGIDPALPVMQANEEKDLFSINQAVVIHDQKEVLLNKRQTRMLNVLTNSFSNVGLNVSNDNIHFVVSANNPKISYVLHTDGDQPYAAFHVTFKGIIEESLQDLQAKDMPKYERMAKPALAKQVQQFLEDMQKENIDPLGLGMRYRARHTDSVAAEMKAWEGIYPKLRFQVKADVDLTSTGLTE
ncbi:Ger(x)C family spore germination protein [Ectobacillus ponti]|uniref:Ger(X)C family spore germination protein n=1 Tax=Ectobacillus ponti TaxID=2961894 RepID=A0AA42BQK0_9BACI|nr:Ger(x)C family spore germination protein [Ectobacillus ponti]MCP8969476.1 Ger(x)C family spore germination protein [Ectobacillus ponti]